MTRRELRNRARSYRSVNFLPTPLLAWATLLLPAFAAAQSTLGSIRGSVRDPLGGAVPAASVLLVDEATGVRRSLVADASGNFEAAFLRPGTYRVEVGAPRFKTFVRTGVTLSAAGLAFVDARLVVGGVDEVVTVAASGLDDVTLEGAALAHGIDAQQLRDLPRNKRDVQDFLVLTPGVVATHEDPQFLGGRSYGVLYVQDGQPSGAPIFGTLSSAAPGLEAVAEMRVLSTAGAEYGGLATVVVTSRRGGAERHSAAFYDFGADELNALSYGQKLAGVRRGDPTSDTHDHRFGLTLSGPIARGRTFYLVSYEGSRQREIGGGVRAVVPSEAMRRGDFSQAGFVVVDPLSGQPFPGNVIPPDRLDPAARRITDFFYPLPNQGLLANGFGVFQQFVPLDRRRDRADLRLDHEAGDRNSLFARISWQRRDPDGITFEGGPALTNLGTLDQRATAFTIAAGWTRIGSGRIVNELRAGYNLDDRHRRSGYVAGEVAALLGIEIPDLAARVPGFPTFMFSGANRPADIRDQRANSFRDLRQASLSLSDTVGRAAGSHTLKAGGIVTRNLVRDGYSTGANESKGRYDFGASTGNSYADFLLGLPSRVREQRNTRGDRPLDAASTDFALFVQDDWRVRPDLTLSLGLRYERIGLFRDEDNLFANFDPSDGGHHVVPNAEVAALLPPGAQALGRTLLASELGLGPELIRPDTSDWGPRLGFSYRPGDGRTALRGGAGLFHPTSAAQGARDVMSRNPFRYFVTRGGATLQHGFTTGTVSTSQGFGNQGVAFDLQSPDVYQYHLTLERELPGGLGFGVSYLGATMKKLLVFSDRNTVRAGPEPLGNVDEDAEARARLPYPLYGTFMDVVDNAGEGQLHAFQARLRRSWRAGLGLDAAYTLAFTDGNAPDTGNSTIGTIQYDPYDIEKDRGPDPHVPRHRFLVNGTWEVPVGRGRRFGDGLPGWADALAGGWTLSFIFQARSGHFLTPFFSYGTSPIFPANTGRELDGVGCFCEAWRPDQVGSPQSGGSRERFFDVGAYALPAPGTLGNAKRGSLVGPGAWVFNLALYKDVVRRRAFKASLSIVLENAFNHPQFFVDDLGVGFVDLTDFLLNGIADNGSTAVLGAGTVGSAEGFSAGRVVRLGLRLTF